MTGRLTDFFQRRKNRAKNIITLRHGLAAAAVEIGAQVRNLLVDRHKKDGGQEYCDQKSFLRRADGRLSRFGEGLLFAAGIFWISRHDPLNKQVGPSLAKAAKIEQRRHRGEREPYVFRIFSPLIHIKK